MESVDFFHFTKSAVFTILLYTVGMSALPCECVSRTPPQSGVLLLSLLRNRDAARLIPVAGEARPNGTRL
jgi:hypothetical protein